MPPPSRSRRALFLARTSIPRIRPRTRKARRGRSIRARHDAFQDDVATGSAIRISSRSSSGCSRRSPPARSVRRFGHQQSLRAHQRSRGAAPAQGGGRRGQACAGGLDGRARACRERRSTDGRHPRHGRHARLRQGRAGAERAAVPRAVGRPRARAQPRHGLRGPVDDRPDALRDRAVSAGVLSHRLLLQEVGRAAGEHADRAAASSAPTR